MLEGIARRGADWSRRGFLGLAAAAMGGAAEEPSGSKFAKNRNWRQSPIDRVGPLSYYIDGAQEALGGREGDPELASWALQVWDHAVSGRLCFYPTDAKSALVRVYWGQVGDGLGKMQAIPVGEMRGAEIYVRPDPENFSFQLEKLCEGDELMRDVIVYRTLVHEIGHGLGLVHTTGVDDVMYFGGDVAGFYRNYRDKVKDRRAMRFERGLSATDLERIRLKYPELRYIRPPKPPKEETTKL